MNMNFTGRRLAVGAVSLAIASTALLTGQASASSNTINGWSTWSAPVRCIDSGGASTWFCLYYNSGAEGAIVKKYDSHDPFIEDTFWSDQYGSAGNGQAVRNNAASVENPSWGTIGVYTKPWYQGDVNFIRAGGAGT